MNVPLKEIHIELKQHHLYLDDMIRAIEAYADDIDYGNRLQIWEKLKGQSGCTHVSLTREDWTVIAYCLRLTDDHSSAAYIESHLGDD